MIWRGKQLSWRTVLRRRYLGPIIAGTVVLMACAPASSSPSSSPGSTQKPSGPLKVALVSEPTSFDPSVETSKVTLVQDNTMLETLAINAPDQSVKPWLAESWTPTSSTKWRVKLKQGVKFHNGEPFNADAVTFSVNVFLTTKGQARGFFTGFLTGAEKIDEYTVDLITNAPTAVVPSSLAFLYAFPPKYYAQVGSDGFGSKPVGTGPWRFGEWTKGVQLRVERNPEYWGPKPLFDEINFRWVPDPSTRVALLQTGEVDLTQQIPPSLVAQLSQSGKARAEAVQSLRKVYFQMNLTEGPTADVRVRQAINYAVDVDSIISGLFKGQAFRDRGIIPAGFEGYQPNLQPFKYDPAQARKLLADAGYASGFQTTLWHTVGRYVLDKEAAEAVAQQLSNVGIRATLQGMEAAAYFSKINGGQKVPGLSLNSCAPLFMNPLFCATYNFQPGVASAYGATEKTGTFIKDATATLEAPQRASIYTQFENYVTNDLVPWLWLWHQQDVFGASNRINWKARSDELMTFADITLK
jgi:peptide/nickel transport system substrate-binding protein